MLQDWEDHSQSHVLMHKPQLFLNALFKKDLFCTFTALFCSSGSVTPNNRLQLADEARHFAFYKITLFLPRLPLPFSPSDEMMVCHGTRDALSVFNHMEEVRGIGHRCEAVPRHCPQCYGPLEFYTSSETHPISLPRRVLSYYKDP